MKQLILNIKYDLFPKFSIDMTSIQCDYELLGSFGSGVMTVVSVGI